MNIVELFADNQHASPCLHGNIVDGHACYCHHPERCRKCPIWRHWGESDLAKWHKREWPIEKWAQTYYGENDPRNVYVWSPQMPDDGLGGCPSFEQNPDYIGQN